MDKKIILIIFLSILFISIILFFVFRKKNRNILERWDGPGNVPWLAPTKYMVQLYRGNTNIFSTESPEMYSTVSSNPVFNIGNIPDGYYFYIYRKVKTNNVYPDSWGNPLTYGTDYTSTTNLDGTISITDIKNPWNPPYSKPLNNGNYYIYKYATDSDTPNNIDTSLASINLSTISTNTPYNKLTDIDITNPILSMKQVYILLIGFIKTTTIEGYIYRIKDILSNKYLYIGSDNIVRCVETINPTRECSLCIYTSGSKFIIKSVINNLNLSLSNNILTTANIDITWDINSQIPLLPVPSFTKPINTGNYYIYKLSSDIDAPININTPLASINLSTVSSNTPYSKLTNNDINNPILSIKQIYIIYIGPVKTKEKEGYLYRLKDISTNRYLYVGSDNIVRCVETTSLNKEYNFFITNFGDKFIIKSIINNNNICPENNILTTKNIDVSWNITTNQYINLVKPSIPINFNNKSYYIKFNNNTNITINEGCGNFSTLTPIFFAYNNSQALCTDISGEACLVEFNPVYRIEDNYRDIQLQYNIRFKNPNGTDISYLTDIGSTVMYMKTNIETNSYWDIGNKDGKYFFRNIRTNNIVGYCMSDGMQRLKSLSIDKKTIEYASLWELFQSVNKTETIKVTFSTTMVNDNEGNYLCNAVGLNYNIPYGPGKMCVSKGISGSGRYDINNKNVYYFPDDKTLSYNSRGTSRREEGGLQFEDYNINNSLFFNKVFRIIPVTNDTNCDYFYIQSVRDDFLRVFLAVNTLNNNEFLQSNNVYNDTNTKSWSVDVRTVYYFRFGFQTTAFGNITYITNIQNLKDNMYKNLIIIPYIYGKPIGNDSNVFKCLCACNNRIMFFKPIYNNSKTQIKKPFLFKLDYV